ncbi:PsbP-related protein [uncultured Methanobrevibacter sp.]|uniref:PsbP-related protein n=1 Tax=uncultured Methanobrevibacter sp. TaxID=253161 RepID=UPI002631A704|nr:PsbP-related protein [uncultured Methanobrevibacter sp.]
MKDNFIKGSIITLMLLLFLISAVSVVSADDNADEDLSVLTLSKGGITIQYPSTWGVAEPTSNYSIMAISKIDSIDALGVGQVNINIEKKELDGEFYSSVNQSYKSMQKDPSFQLISSGSVSVGGMDALEYIYTSSQGAGEKEHKAIWFEKGGQAYVIMYSAPIDQFEDNLYVFDFVLSEIQIT